MAARMFNLTITAAAQALSAAIAGDASRGGPRDEAYRQLILSTTTDCFIGDSTVTTSNYGKKIFTDTNATPPTVLGPFPDGPVKLSDLYVVGTSGTLHILGIPY